MLVVEDKPTRHPVGVDTPAEPEPLPNPASKKRLNCNDIVERLTRMIGQGDKIPGYYTAFKPKTTSVKNLPSQAVTVRKPLELLLLLDRELGQQARGKRGKPIT